MTTDQKIVKLDIRLADTEVLRMMGFPAGTQAEPGLRDLLEDLLADARSVIDAQCIYTLHDIEWMDDHFLKLVDHDPINGPINAFFKPARRAAVFMATLGEGIEKVTHHYAQVGDKEAAEIMHAVGLAATDALSEAFVDHLQWNEISVHESMSPPFCPGQCGLAREVNQRIFSILGDSELSIELRDDSVLHPRHSVTGLIGIGDETHFSEHGVPCQWCNLGICKLGRKKDTA